MQEAVILKCVLYVILVLCYVVMFYVRKTLGMKELVTMNN